MTDQPIDQPEIHPDDLTSVAVDIEAMLEDALQVTDARLVDRRLARDRINAQIKVLVADRETIAQALRPFKRKQPPPADEQ